ncbi:hypothetical protein EST38_g1908 [Candolleomyces aberdarensis]|uniref:DUF6589 domain-containing protein n=1 Tax=Candolleomyces aberdarensis TaxID=2316362 RepID=A0A4V1Q509_9AGAR|nr:hypothetical protein EST38_g1908 [Candolleomyces aberdarensis]
MASKIRQKYATPTPEHPQVHKQKANNPDGPDGPGKSDSAIPDPIHKNVLRLTRDLLLIKEIVSAIKDGDIGRVEDILVDFALLFCGAGSNNYANKVLHLMYNLKLVWTPEPADIMCDTMLINVSRLPGHAMGIDRNIEHLIGYLKALFAAKGFYGQWEQCGSISASIHNLMALEKRVAASLKLNYQGSTHSAVDTRDVVLHMESKAKELKLQEIVPGQEGKLRPDLRVLGHRKMESMGLPNFNKRIEGMCSGIPASVELEVDEISPLDLETIDTSDILDL